uniref:Uncharacterized protein n=1 Tax=Anguilla anguilla TaxID=7936 RepID=A0A0E9UEZ9_ANGAN
MVFTAPSKSLPSPSASVKHFRSLAETGVFVFDFIVSK